MNRFPFYPNSLLHRVSLALGALLLAGSLHANAGNQQSLVTIGRLQVTAADLEQAVASSPFATQFAAMDEDDQASLRGDLLKRLVLSRLLRIEAEAQGLDRSPEFLEEVENFRLGMLYRHYMDKLRERLRVPDDELLRLRKESNGNSDVFTALKSAYISDRYRQVRLLTLQKLRDERHVVLHEDRIKPGITPDTVLMEGDGLRITYGDVIEVAEYPKLPNPEYVKEQLYKRGELLLIADVAQKEGVDVSERVEAFRNERLPALLIEHKEKEWVPDEAAMRAYFEAHPELGHVVERRHVGQLVTSSYAQAKALRRRIEQGESLFKLAGEYSIDPYGRSHNGDMGWVRQGSGMPQIEAALARLKDGEVSPIVKTPKGYHLLTIVERRLGRMRPFEGVRDKVRQAMISEKMKAFIGELEQKYQIVWHVLKKPEGGES
ncbi:peptidylprolyl isomerase [endosymbiont of unidentified scaly snail isolate Monju]|uniref:peptidylprolyl isomerase n=1 Tax=endosymbiont of unidentified scaly snail isolate Monju TaxID=1248727 RepID=UPI0003892A03|nr:peptidylprolyl isomerase [endosymbiont of unidentified scaly snail isolate Monju]BAN68312.1 peptidyl-prolyl cis-trans isomerase C [endosymbiont of unidentified scaly snail isolate Monju]